MKQSGPQNPNTSALIRVLSSSEAPIWKRVAKEISTPKRSITVVNVKQLDKLTKENDVICVPGKVLGMGLINKKVTIAALNFSDSAESKIKAAGGSTFTINDLAIKHPKGTGVRIIKGAQSR
ncbi:MAG: 50S ribosomal protein L18e [Candidatus Hodarchaeales archaeon]|jgi:large subunit ribosomal protein L18e